MKKFLLIFGLTLCMVFAVQGQIVTTIAEVQDTTGTGSGDSKYLDSLVTVEGIVSGEIYAYGSTYFVQDGSGPWNGILVYDPDREMSYGDSIRITATVSEYFGMTQLSDVEGYELLGEGKTVEPTVVTSGEIATGGVNAEAYEGVLVQVVDAEIADPDLGYGEWSIDDGSGACRVDDAADYFFNPESHDSVKYVIGPLNYSFGDTKIIPRLAMDIRQGGEFTRIQWFQQVRHSDLLKAFEDETSDISYAYNDTVTVTGIVTMPTGLSYAGDGVKFIINESDGGPWSAVLSYDADSTAVPQLFDGDSIIMTGYVFEYTTGPANMTELFNTSPIQIVGIGKDLPEPNYVETGDLRLPETAEQWGNVMVYVKDAVVTNNTFQYELYEVDDGSGGVLVDDDSDSLINYYAVNPLPPTGTIADSIRGWVYHHFGSYFDSSAYKLEPLYMWDILWGAGPPLVSNETRNIAAPQPSDDVVVSADFATNLTIAEAALYYKVDTGDYTKVVMTNTTGDTYEGTIPAMPAGSFVSYYMVGTDDADQSTVSPSDTSIQNYCYSVITGDVAIKDVQYNPWPLADTPLEGFETTLTGTVVADTAANTWYEAYSIQDAEGAWNGVFLFGIEQILARGDEVTVTGTMTDYNPDWGFKWNNNTVMLVDELTVNGTGETINAAAVTSGELDSDTTTAEMYEGVLVRISNAELKSINSYDVTFDDGSGPCLVDGDLAVEDDGEPNSKFYLNSDEGYLVAYGDTIRPGEIVDNIQGVFVYSFGTYKISVRDGGDWGAAVGINQDFEIIPLSYKLKQNFPNPFNPETKIYFEIPEANDVSIVIYNMLGQKVRTLVDDNYKAGQHIVNWNGTNDQGIRLSTGVYFYRIKAGDFIASKKMLMLK
jgi:hypothetical protein